MTTTMNLMFSKSSQHSNRQRTLNSRYLCFILLLKSLTSADHNYLQTKKNSNAHLWMNC